jgi:enoyl-CoA hydratase/carnithine racemase
MVEKLMERDYFLDAEQALEMGLVDKVLTNRAEREHVLAPLKGEAAAEEKKGDAKTDGKNGDDGDGSDAGNTPPPESAPAPKESSS